MYINYLSVSGHHLYIYVIKFMYFVGKWLYHAYGPQAFIDKSYFISTNLGFVDNKMHTKYRVPHIIRVREDVC